MNRTQRSFPMVIRKGGEVLIPAFPIDLGKGDQLIVVKEMQGWESPYDKVTINGYSISDPIITGKS